MLIATLRHLREEYSLVITLVPTKIAPTPIPVIARQKPSAKELATNAEPSIPIAERETAISNRLRRPILSANGAKNREPPVIPIRPALKR